MSRLIQAPILFALVAGCTARTPTPSPEIQPSSVGSALSDNSEDVESGEELVAYPNSDFSPSFAALMTQPNRFHGRHIQLSGFICLDFEASAIYLSKDHADNLVTQEGFWVSFDTAKLASQGLTDLSTFDHQWVSIDGVFDKDNRGHRGAWPGSIENIDRIYALRPHPPVTQH